MGRGLRCPCEPKHGEAGGTYSQWGIDPLPADPPNSLARKLYPPCCEASEKFLFPRRGGGIGAQVPSSLWLAAGGVSEPSPTFALPAGGLDFLILQFPNLVQEGFVEFLQ